MSKENENFTRVRYSDEELESFKRMIAEKLEDARTQINQLKEQLTEMNGSSDASRAGTFEDGASNWQREHLNKLAARQQRFIRDLENAMIRIKNKTYGVCVVTGHLIDKKRLELVPHATKSIEGKMGNGRQPKRAVRMRRDRPRKIVTKVLTPTPKKESVAIVIDAEDDDMVLGTDTLKQIFSCSICK